MRGDRIFLFLCAFTATLLFIPGAFEFTYRIKWYFLPSFSFIYLFFILEKERDLKFSFFHLLFFLFFLFSLVSLFNSYSISRTIEAVFCLLGLFAFSIALFNDEKKGEIFKYILLCVFILVCGGYIQYFLHIAGIKELPKDAYGTPMINFGIGHRNPFSHVVASTIPLIFFLIPFPLSLFGGLFFTGISLLSGSRAGVFGSLFSLMAAALIQKRYKKLILFIPFLILIFLSPPFKSALKKTINKSYEPNRIRVLLWEDSINIFKKHPILGCGLSAFPSALPFFWSDETAFLVSSKYQEQFVENAHNDIISNFAETGIFGGFIFLVMIGYGIFSIFKSKEENSRFLLISILTIFLISLIDYPFRNPATLFLALSIFSFTESRVLFRMKLNPKTFLLSGLVFAIVGVSSLFVRVKITSLYMRFLKVPNPYSAGEFIQTSKKFLFDPIFYKGYYYMGNLYAVKGDMKAAEIYYRKCLNLFRGHFVALFNLAEAKIKNGEIDFAKAILLDLLKISPYHLKANELISIILRYEGRAKEAMFYEERMRKIRERR